MNLVLGEGVQNPKSLADVIHVRPLVAQLLLVALHRLQEVLLGVRQQRLARLHLQSRPTCDISLQFPRELEFPFCHLSVVTKFQCLSKLQLETSKVSNSKFRR